MGRGVVAGTASAAILPKTPMSPSYGVTPTSYTSGGQDAEIAKIRELLEGKADEEAMHQMLTKLAQMQSTIESLSYRCIYLERQQAKDREKSQKEIDDNNVQILKRVHDFRTAFEMERVSRLEREAQLLKRIGEDKQQLLQKLDAERMARESSVNVVRDEIDQSTGKLSRMLQMETTHRGEREDDILRALNQYSVLLQSLTATN